MVTAPHLAPRTSVQRVMLQVLVALVPATVAWVWLFGTGLLVNAALCAVTALATEAAMVHLRGRPVAPVLADCSALVTAVLLAFALPPDVPWWIPVVGTAFAMVFAKHLYGGIGFNPFNPAMVGYVVLLISFPVEMTRWPLPSVLAGWDAVSSATPLDAVRTGLASGMPLSEIHASPLFAYPGGTGWTVLNLTFVVGGLWLLWTRTIRWIIPLTVLGSIAVLSGGAWLVDAERFASPAFHILGGATLMCAFFIATDPVSAATTPRGRIAYGIGIGALVWIIRTFGGYPDAVAFAVLLMNMAAPTLDHYLGERGTRDAS